MSSTDDAPLTADELLTAQAEGRLVVYPKQLTRADLKRMSPGSVVTAQKAGRLDTLLGRVRP
jgi:hypothetical protein